ncbi:cation diffusion facilitator family transporter [Sansalvadorimonas verongulae]|uniref:cation diffusion facilitator family transporter n=1 Tax=Sansalvadorimonas verongulae TaxID=2172824 RepID=UPI0012BC0FD5|nr:cation diffusion facilitator family transporter [Sansalvadorimonas verongulae]MTI13292.1 cation transporter [Sansalvadorimonas verongulae]
MTTDSDTVSEISRVTWVGLWINAALSVLKIVAGTLGHSRAVVADGLHSLSDLISDIAVLVGVRLWSAPADDDHPYGHQRFETLITLFIGIMMILTAAGISWDAVTSWHAGETHEASTLALVAALVSIVTKEGLFRWTLFKGKKINSSALIANAWHHRSDVLSSMPAALAVIGSMIFPGAAWIDLGGACLISLLILHSALGICAPALGSLVDQGASKDITEQLHKLASGVNGVRSIHRLRTRHHGGLFVDMHLAVDCDLTVYQGHEIALAVESLLMQEGANVAEVLIHVDPWCENTCVVCPNHPVTG